MWNQLNLPCGLGEKHGCKEGGWGGGGGEDLVSFDSVIGDGVKYLIAGGGAGGIVSFKDDESEGMVERVEMEENKL